MNANQILQDGKLSLPRNWEVRDITTTKVRITGSSIVESLVIEQYESGPGPFMVSLLNRDNDHIITNWTCSWGHLVAMIGVWSSLAMATGGVPAFKEIGKLMSDGRAHLTESDRTHYDLIARYYAPEGLPDGRRMIDPAYEHPTGDFSEMLDRMHYGRE